MEILQTNKLILFIAFVMPGFLMLKTYQLMKPSAELDSARQIIDAISYSVINYGILLFPIILIELSEIDSQYPLLYGAFWFAVVVIIPVGWAFIYHKLRATQLFQRWLPHPALKPWDYVFGKRKAYWVIVTLKDGGKIGGRYDSFSFASSHPAPEQIYLEEAWLINDEGGFDREKDETAGILILGPEIATVELFSIEEADTDAKPKQAK